MLRAANRLASQATNSEKFEKVRVESDRTLSLNHNPFYNEMKTFIRSMPPKGHGRWLWKPYLVNYHLNNLEGCDGLLYIDAGCFFNFKSKIAEERFNHYLEMTMEHGSLAMQLVNNAGGTGDLFDSNYNSIDLMDFVGLPKESRNTCQIQATFLFVTPQEKSLNLVAEWLKLCQLDDFRFLRENLIKSKSSEFKEYRWDQSILSALYKKNEMFSLPDESWWGNFDWELEGANYPIWAMRHRSGSAPFRPTLKDFPDRALTRLNL